MRSTVLAFVALLIIPLGISECKVQPGSVTVSGTASAPNWSSITPGKPVVSVSGVDRIHSAPVPVTGASGSESYSFPIPSVPREHTP